MYARAMFARILPWFISTDAKFYEKHMALQQFWPFYIIQYQTYMCMTCASRSWCLYTWQTHAFMSAIPMSFGMISTTLRWQSYSTIPRMADLRLCKTVKFDARPTLTQQLGQRLGPSQRDGLLGFGGGTLPLLDPKWPYSALQQKGLLGWRLLNGAHLKKKLHILMHTIAHATAEFKMG